MKRLTVICFLIAAIMAMPLAAFTADEKPAPKKQKGRVIAELKVFEHAIVKAVDLKSRKVTLEMADGKQQEFVIDKQVKKLDKVEVGDMVKVSYREAVTVRLKKTKVTPSVTVDASLEKDATSVKPAGTVKRQVTVIATIDKIYDNGTAVTLRTPDGNTFDARVSNPENLAKIKKGEVKEGDQVEITYTQALALSVEKVPKSDK